MLKVSVLKPLALVALVAGSMQVNAHRAWVLPDATVFAGEKSVATFDAAVSNMIFNFDHVAVKPETFTILNPAGDKLEPQNPSVSRYRGSFDLPLTTEGTYKVFSASAGLRAMWEDNDGKRQFYPGRGEAFDADTFKAKVPTKAKNLKVSQFSRRLETFVTAGAPNDTVLKTTGQGLELKPITHPNDLFAGEAAKFQFLIDGKPAKGVEITIIKEGTRYRNAPEEINLSTDKNGQVSVNWQGAGRYFLEAEYKDTQAKKPATERTGQYVVVLEVLPD